MDRLEKLGIIRKGLTGYTSPVLLVKRKQQNLYRVVTDFRVLNERLVQVNHAFPIVRDCLEAIGVSKCGSNERTRFERCLSHFTIG